ncbi:MAG: cation:proton antiporter, partial [Myxococcota bacterium]
IGLVSGGELWGWFGLVMLVATLGKLVGTAVPARLGGLGWRESATIGVLMNTRGLMELVILNIGRDLGVLSPVLFTMLVLMAVVTTFVTSPVVRWLQPPARVLAGATPAAGEPAAVLACVAHPDSAVGLARVTAALCHGEKARGWALRLTPLGHQATLFPEEEVVEPEEDAATLLVAEARRLGAEVRALSFPSSDPARDIVAVAGLTGADVILLGLHRPLMGTARLGGPLREITQHAHSDVCMFQDAGLEQVRNVLLVPGGEHAEAVERVAARLARDPGVTVTRLPGNAGIPELLAAARGRDLVIASVGSAWGLPMNAFDVREHPLVTALPCSLLAVHGAQAD